MQDEKKKKTKSILGSKEKNINWTGEKCWKADVTGGGKKGPWRRVKLREDDFLLLSVSDLKAFDTDKVTSKESRRERGKRKIRKFSFQSLNGGFSWN